MSPARPCRPVAPTVLAVCLACLAAMPACEAEESSPAAAGATDKPTPHPSLQRAADAPGPFNVGYRKLSITYEAGGAAGKRTIPLHLWYPTGATTGDHPAAYGGLVADKTSLKDVPAAAPEDGKAWPVMVYTHGHQGFAGSSAFVALRYASHGWVVAAPDHVGNLLSDAILPRPTWMYHARSSDLREALDRVATLGGADGFGAGKTATDRVIVVGHSFGAHDCWATAGAGSDSGAFKADCAADGGHIKKGDCAQADLDVFAAGSRDKRVVAAVVMAGKIHSGLMGAKGHESTAAPLLAITGTKDDIGYAKEWDRIQGIDHTWIDLDGATHQSFAVACSLAGATDKGCPVINHWALAFGRRHVLGDDAQAALLDGKAARSKLIVRYERRTP